MYRNIEVTGAESKFPVLYSRGGLWSLVSVVKDCRMKCEDHMENMSD